MSKKLFVAVGLLGLAACGGSGGSASTAPPPVNNNPGNTAPPANGIAVTNNAYTPGDKTVAVGSTVKWSWSTCEGDVYTGQSCTSHSVTFDDGVTSATQSTGSFDRTFSAPGVYKYHCAIHGAAMAGTITVQ